MKLESFWRHRCLNYTIVFRHDYYQLAYGKINNTSWEWLMWPLSGNLDVYSQSLIGGTQISSTLQKDMKEYCMTTMYSPSPRVIAKDLEKFLGGNLPWHFHQEL